MSSGAAAPRISTSTSAAERLAAAREWLASHPPAALRLVVAPSFDAGIEIGRRIAAESASGALLGLHCETLPRLAAALAAPRLAASERVAIGPLASEAVMARVLRPMREPGASQWLARVADAPRLPRVFRQTADELRQAASDVAAIGALPEELATLCVNYAAELASSKLADRASVLWAAVEALEDEESTHPLVGLPTAFVDLAIESEAEARFVAALAKRAPAVFVAQPAGEQALVHALRLGGAAQRATSKAAGSLARLQQRLFDEGQPGEVPLGPGSEPDGQVVFSSAPGEGRECVELVREMRRFAEQGVAFDRMAVLLRSPEEYRGTLEEAFERSGIPFHAARGSTRPDPAGRAFLALLSCAAEGLSASAFAEYLSLAQLPASSNASSVEHAGSAGGDAADGSDREWVAPDLELLPRSLAEEAREAEAAAHGELAALEAERGTAPAESAVRVGTLRVPRRFEGLLVDAAVIGGKDRWERRLAGLAAGLAHELVEVGSEEPARAERVRERAGELEALQGFALPLVARLAALPEEASWGTWIEHLSGLAHAALRHPARIESVLSELLPMQGVDGVDLPEVRRVLEARLREVAVPPGPDRYGKVYVASCEAARGLCFDVVFVPGLAEKLFPRKITQDPVLPDAARAKLALDGLGLASAADRVARERSLLRIAVGAAERAVVLSYPRVDVERNRPRVPSFYALEAVRAAEGALPGFDELARRAEGRSRARLGWPAPAQRSDAIDEAEHDLVLLEELSRVSEAEALGRAHFLLESNPHLGRALRFRARRWLRRWTPADGLLAIDDPKRRAVEPHAKAAIAEHALAARSYSATALQAFSQCPYRFFLYAVLRLAPREVPEAIDELDALQRGSLVHDVQFEFLQRLREAGRLPIAPARLASALEELDSVIAEVAGRYHEELAPAIERVWKDGVEAIRADLREWLRRLAERDDGFVPAHFELAFGLGQGSLAAREQRDPASSRDAVQLDCGIQLRGSIDLVERCDDGSGARLRVVDHKTGKVRFKERSVIDGGRVLQPVLYALAAERLFPEASVERGSLWYCTSAGTFSERHVELDPAARAAAEAVAKAVGASLEEPFLPAAPDEGACRFCDFQPVCGPYEELRSGRKPSEALVPLTGLREQR